MSITNSTAHNRDRQAGMVAIMVTLILMIVISLIVLGFAQISRRNQRQSLDRQLSTQAFYAAETAINDVRNLFKNTPAGTTIPAKPDCSGGSGAAAVYYAPLSTSSTIDAASNVAYTCVTVNPAPTSLAFDKIGTTGTIIPIIPANGSIDVLYITWKTTDPNNATPLTNCPISDLITVSWGCGYGLLRFDLVPTTGSFSIDSLMSTTMTSFLVPRSAGGTQYMSYVTTGGNNLKGVFCTNTSCSIGINALTASQYYMRLSSFYKEARVEITATDSSGNAISFMNAQAVIDATGKAQDVLRRVQVHIPINTAQNELSDYAIQSTESVCKRFYVMENLFDPAVTGVTSTNPLCQP